MNTLRYTVYLVAIIIFTSIVNFGQGYKKPPQEIIDVLDAPALPVTSVSPAKDAIAMFERLNYPPISDMAKPMLRLAGLRINPKTNSRHSQRYFVGVKLKNISTGNEIAVNLPKGARIISPTWSADGKYLAAGNVTNNGVELWIIETKTAIAKKINNAQVNTAFGGFEWMPDQKSLIATLVPANRGTAPSVSSVPTSPSIQETSGRAAAIRTYQDLLKSPNDEKLLDYYVTSQLAIIGMNGEIKKINEPAIYNQSEVSPDGKYILTSRITKPYSYLFPIWSFPNEIDVVNTKGDSVYKVASVPIRDNLPVGGVTTSPRRVDWIPTEPSTLMWAEALDGGNPKKKAQHRDKLVTHKVPTKMMPRELLRTEHRYSGSLFGERNGMMWVYDYDRDKRRRRILMTDYRNPKELKAISDLNVRDRYNALGNPVMKVLDNGKSVISQNDLGVLLTGRGASPQGDRPFLRLFDPNTSQKTDLFRSSGDSFESVVSVLNSESNFFFITRKESATVPPNLHLKWTCRPKVKCNKPFNIPRQLTAFIDPTPQLRGITKKLVKYKRADGVDLSFTLYLPPDYKEGDKLPALLWAYPLEYTNKGVAGQVSGSTNRFTSIRGYSHLFLLTQGYAILNNATVPVVGDPLTVNDTFIEQLIAGAKAAVDKGAEMGVIDPDRVAVGGHSYGAFMTAHLLANSDIFRAGIARSGAYNRTLTPFGFQSERRSFWEAPESYYTLSPFMRAHKINEPILMTHGEADNNSGTYPLQSKRMFAAIRGNGGTARLVMLPHESHGYRARESVEHVLWEQIQWMDKYVKNAKPRTKKSVAK